MRGLLWLAAIFGAIAFLLHLFLFDTWVVPEDDALFLASVQPTLFPQDRLLVHRKAVPHSGQLARCVSPENPTQYVVGRVFGGQGDRVELQGGRVLIQGKVVSIRHGCPPVTLVHPATGRDIELTCGVEDNGSWTYAVLTSSQGGAGQNGGGGVIEAGKLFLVSDDRHLHQDSRDFGQVDAESCEHIVYRLWGKSFQDASRRFTILW